MLNETDVGCSVAKKQLLDLITLGLLVLGERRTRKVAAQSLVLFAVVHVWEVFFLFLHGLHYDPVL